MSFLPTKYASSSAGAQEFTLWKWLSPLGPLEPVFGNYCVGGIQIFFLGGIAILFIVGPDQLVFSGSLLWDPCAAGLKLAFWKNLFGLDLRGNQRSLSDKLFVLSLLALRY